MYLERWAQGDLEARNTLIEHNLRLVAHIMKKVLYTQRDQEDLISIGTIGLIKGSVPSSRTRTCAWPPMPPAVSKMRSSCTSAPSGSCRGGLLSDSIDGDGDGNSLSLMDTISVDDNMLEELDARDSCAKVRRCVKRCLDEREAMIITLRYGLNARPPLTQREIAAQCGISRSYVSRRGYASAEGDVSGGRDGPDGDATLTAVSEREKPASRRRPGVPDVRPTSTPVVQSAQRIPEVSGHQVNEYAVGGTAGQVPSGQGIQKAVVLKFPAVPDYGADSALHRD